MSIVKNGIDIIIPIYNAYDDLLLCLDSIKKHTDLYKNRLILVNDKSPDERILPYLKEQQNNNIILIDSIKNEGFSASVNKGINYSNNDVLLLNSDTIVTKGWIEKIVACAYSQEEIGTVTPLSNSATLCSVPVFCQDNNIPSNVTIDEFAEIIEKCSLKKYPEITVAVGFCMFIKREVIKCVGLFDAETFENGYGEENDFCNRAEQYGYKHIMCDDTFIYHKGTGSFQSEEKKKLIKKHEVILYDRYRRQMEKNHKYCMDNPDQDIRDNINLYLKLKNGKKNLLYLIHSDFREDAGDNIGGTQLHVKDLVYGLRDNYNTFVIAPDENFFRLTIYIGNEMMTFKFYIDSKKDYPIFSNGKHAEIYKNILNAFSIDIVHIHHTFGLSLDLFYEAKKLEIPIVTTVHDYYYICPTIKLLNHQNNICIGCETTEMCQKCLRLHYDIAETVDYIPHWRDVSLKVLLLCDRIIAPSSSAKDIFIKYYPELNDKIHIIEHGSDKLNELPQIRFENLRISEKCKIHIEKTINDSSENIIGWAYIEKLDSYKTNIYIEVKDDKGNCEIFHASKSQREDVSGNNKEYIYSGFNCHICKDYFNEGKIYVKIILENNGEYTNGEIYEYKIKSKAQNNGLNVAFIGGLNAAKGSEFAYKLIKYDKDVMNWYIFGGISDAKLSGLNQKNLVKTGAYSRENISKLVEKFKIDLICILPIWHETFCYTLSEALLCHVPVIVTDMGAVGERVKKMDCGWSLPNSSSYTDYYKLIQKININREEYNCKLNKVKQLNLRNINDMIRDYESIYTELYRQNRISNHYNASDIYSGYINLQKNIRVKDYEEQFDKLYQAEKKLQLIQSSITYKVAVKLRELKIPFREQLKRIFIKVYYLFKKLR